MFNSAETDSMECQCRCHYGEYDSSHFISCCVICPVCNKNVIGLTKHLEKYHIEYYVMTFLHKLKYGDK